MSDKRITVEDLKKAVKEVSMPVEQTFDWNGLELRVKKYISLQEMLEFCGAVTAASFNDETGEYFPELKDFVFKTCLLEHYSNVDLPEKPDEKYEFLYNTDIVEVVFKSVDRQQIQEILNTIELRIKYLVNSKIEALHKRMNEVAEQIEKFGTLFQNLFEDVDSETMQKLVKAMSDGEINEEKIVKAYMSQTKPDQNSESDKPIENPNSIKNLDKAKEAE